jgi:hypothetical protein
MSERDEERGNDRSGQERSFVQMSLRLQRMIHTGCFYRNQDMTGSLQTKVYQYLVMIVISCQGQSQWLYSHFVYKRPSPDSGAASSAVISSISWADWTNTHLRVERTERREGGRVRERKR